MPGGPFPTLALARAIVLTELPPEIYLRWLLMTEPIPALEHPDGIYLNAAVGWIELGNHREAREELSRLRPEVNQHPMVLDVGWQVHAHFEEWQQALECAKALCTRLPRDANSWTKQAVSLYRLGCPEASFELLRPRVARFPKSFVLHYDLACYACQLGKLEEARQWLRTAFKLGGESNPPRDVLSLALSDPDLTLLWEEIRNWP